MSQNIDLNSITQFNSEPIYVRLENIAKAGLSLEQPTLIYFRTAMRSSVTANATADTGKNSSLFLMIIFDNNKDYNKTTFFFNSVYKVYSFFKFGFFPPTFFYVRFV